VRLIDADALKMKWKKSGAMPELPIWVEDDLAAAPTVCCGECAKNEWCEICGAVNTLSIAQRDLGNPDYSDFGCPYFERREP